MIIHPQSSLFPFPTSAPKHHSHGLDPTDPLAVVMLTVTLVEPIPAIQTAPQFAGDITSTDREGHQVPGKFDPIDHQGVAIPGERLTRDGETSLVLEVRRGGEVAYSKDLTDSLDETLDPDGLQVYFTSDTLYELMLNDGDSLVNGDVVTATFTNALGSTAATGEVYNLP